MSIQGEAERIKGEVSAQEALIAQISAVLDGKAGGGTTAPVEEKDVNFWDYDGTLLYSYTLAEAQALTELPAGPDWHDGLIFDGWNWTLEQLINQNGPMDVGAMYATEDGATWLVLNNDRGKDIEVTFSWDQLNDAGITLDYGDGAEAYVSAGLGTGLKTVTHTYAPGKYTAKLHGQSDHYNVKGTNTQNCVNDIAGAGSSILRRAYIMCKNIGDYAFKNCRRLEAYCVSQNTERYRVQAFSGCTQLKFAIVNAISVASGVLNNAYGVERASYGAMVETTYAFPPSVRRVLLPHTLMALNANIADAYMLKSFEIPPLVTSLPQRMFQSCESLFELTIHEAITTINAYAFLYCYSMRRLRFLPVTPPTVANANAFTGIPTDCIVEVPAASLEAYQNATNYSGIAAQMIGV